MLYNHDLTQRRYVNNNDVYTNIRNFDCDVDFDLYISI